MFALLRKSRVRSMLEQFLGSVGVEGPYVSCSLPFLLTLAFLLTLPFFIVHPPPTLSFFTVPAPRNNAASPS